MDNDTPMHAYYLSLQPLLFWQQMPRPIAWEQQFGRQAPLTVEIGFGNGEFLVREALASPTHNLVGIEPEWASVQRGLRRIAQAALPHVRLLLADARLAFERLFLPQSVARIYALFPCPWPKERHTKHRLFAQSFLRLVNSRLAPDGELQVVTDHRSYLDWVLAQVPETGFSAEWTVIPPRFQTKYERKWQAAGQQEFYELRLHKVTHQAIALTEDVAVQTHRVESFDAQRFHPATLPGAITVRVRDFLYDAGRQQGMVWVLVSEDGVTQNFWIEIVRDATSWTIRPARGCGIVPTVGVQRALDFVRDTAQHTT